MAEGMQHYLEEIGKRLVLTKDQEFELFDRYHQGDSSAREEIVACNLRLVVRLALRYQGRGVSLEDLIQEGNIGLLEVIERFDHTLGFRFSTYAAFWIRQAIQVAIRKQGAMIRLPVRKSRQLGKISEIIHEFLSLSGRMPTAEEISERMEMTLKQVEDLMQLTNNTLSIDAVNDETGLTIGDQLQDMEAMDPAEVSMDHEVVQKVTQVLANLTERENSVLRLRFGLNDQRRRSLRSVSRKVGLSQEGVRRVEKRALDKLRRRHVRSQLTGLI